MSSIGTDLCDEAIWLGRQLHRLAPDDGESIGLLALMLLDDARRDARLDPSPVVAVNRALAVGRSDGPPAGLAVLQPVLDDGRLDRYAPLHAVHADLLEGIGDVEGAANAWRTGAARADNAAQREAMLGRAGDSARYGRGRPSP